ncbi:hypothetical protein [Actinoplanes sp. L3-i22]|uniref:hypothetical protein n=1 Tax=Actinoplanes sp. L3-i22 TaxID=2836373 RepID=UPI001C7434A1|nr:hypothetical protein [Actinoplanes sp. L3-i22]BCY10751.1 hypothetical protein L3i22_058390 [Actinoplanes sp. L3-i22]
MTDIETYVIEAELTEEAAGRGIENAVKGRHSVARKYVMWVRGRNPAATPAEIVTVLERHYLTAITVAGGLVTAGSIALEVGIGLLPGGGAAKVAGREAAKVAAKRVAKEMALNATKMGAQHVVTKVLPAGDEQLQFEITALYALALADLHGMVLDQDKTHTLIYGLTNERVAQGQIAGMAADLARSSGAVDVGRTIAGGRQDWSHWADTLAHTLPAGAAQQLMRGMQTGKLEDVRTGLGAKQQALVEYSAGAVAGGVTRFTFGREVIEAAREAFADAPEQFPAHLELREKTEEELEPNRALAAMQDAARSTGNWLGGSAQTIGSGVGTVAGTVARPFQSVDLDGDGIPDEAQALTVVKGAGAAIAGAATSAAGAATSVAGAAGSAAGKAASSVAGLVSSPFKWKKSKAAE